MLVEAILLAVAIPNNQARGASLADYAGKTLQDGESNYERLCTLVEKSFSTKKAAFVYPGSPIHVWSLEDRFIVLGEIDSPFVPGESTAECFVFNKASKPIGRQTFSIGWRTWFKTVSLSRAKGLTSVTITTRLWGGEEAKEIFGLVGSRLALIRFQTAKGDSIPNQYRFPNQAVGSLPPHKSVSDVEVALGSQDRVRCLEALVWLNGEHMAPTSKVSETLHENVRDRNRYWECISSHRVLASAMTLARSPDPWIRNEATRLLRRVRVSSNTADAKPVDTGSLRIEDLKTGHGGEFESFLLRKGDRGVFRLEARLPNGRIFDTNQAPQAKLIVLTGGGLQESEGLGIGIIGMRTGGIRRIIVPPNLAFGSLATEEVPPNTPVTYTVSLCRVVPDGDFSSKPRDLVVGKGPLVDIGRSISFNWKAWTLDGHPISLDSVPNPYMHAPGNPLVDHLTRFINGMRVGGKRRGIVEWAPPFASSFDAFFSVILEIEVKPPSSPAKSTR